MTVSNVESAVIRIGDGVTVDFDFDIEAISAASIKVGYIVGITVVAADPADYSVSMNGGLTGGVVTFLVAPVLGEKLYIYRETDKTQVVSVSRQQGYNPAVVERVWDKLTFIMQELSTAVKRAVKTGPDADPDQLIADLENARVDALAAAAAAEADAIQTAADRVQTGLDRVQTTADAAATAADRVVTTADRIQTQADAAATGADAIATAADRVQTGLDAAQTAGDALATAADRVQTGLDAAATAADRVQTGLDRSAAAASAAEAALYVPTVASQAEAEAGADNTKLMTPLRVRQATKVIKSAAAALTGPAIEWLDIPAEVQRVTMVLSKASVTGTDFPLVQLGTAGGWVSSGYIAYRLGDAGGSSAGGGTHSNGFGIDANGAGTGQSGQLILDRLAPGSNVWIAAYNGVRINLPSSGVASQSSAGEVDLGAELTRIRLVATGSNTYDGGNASLAWEF